MKRSMNLRIQLAALALLACTSCQSSYTWSSSYLNTGHLLGEVDTGEGEKKSYTLHYGSGTAPTVNRTVERTYEVARLGVDVRSVDARMAKDLEIDAWKGVFVDYVADDSAASKAGIVRGDVLLELEGKPLTNREHFIEIVEGELEPGVETSALVSRKSDTLIRTELVHKLTPGKREVQETATDTIDLVAPQGLESRTGLQVATIPEDLTREIWESDETHVYITGVLVGSPGYKAGFRGGDRVRTLDGVQVESAEGLYESVKESGDSFELAVSSPTGDYQSETGTVTSLDKRSTFRIPLIVNYSSTLERTKLTFLDIIFQWGFNYRSSYEGTESREVARRSYLSILPLGMFEFERSPTRSRNTLFWFITWRTRH